MSKARSGPDKELQAMSTILDALQGLDGESIHRVLDYVFGRLSISRPARGTSLAAPLAASGLASDIAKSRQVSIRDLKEEKQPESFNQMAALVAYYLSEHASQDEMKSEISAADLQKYFKQAGFRLPQKMYQLLPNAAAAGYFDSAGGGRYRLNPVGYNLVVHGLPRGRDDAKVVRKRRAPNRKTAKAKR